MSSSSFTRFSKRRDLGSIISDTIGFIRAEGQPLISVVIKVSIIPMIIAICAGLYYAYVTGSIQATSVDEYGYVDPMADLYDIGGSLTSLLLLGLCLAVVQSLIGLATLSYIRSYQENNGKVDFDQVSSLIKSKFASFLGLNILTAIVIGIGMIFCFLPGIYFWGALALSPCILVFNDRGAFDSFGDSFSFTKDYYWNTFGSIFVIWLILAVSGAAINFPITLYATGAQFDMFAQATMNMDELIIDPIYIILNIIGYMATFFFEIVVYVSRAFIFFDIEEQENPSTPDIIDTIGSE